MIPLPVCPINPAWLAIVISILSPFAVHLLAKRRENRARERAIADAKKRQTEDAKTQFKIAMLIIKDNIPRKGFDEFYATTKPQILNAISKLKAFLSTDEAGRLDGLWNEYSQIDIQKDLNDDNEEGALSNFDVRFENAEGQGLKKPSEILKSALGEFIKTDM